MRRRRPRFDPFETDARCCLRDFVISDEFKGDIPYWGE